jgi:hypothetical protein
MGAYLFDQTQTALEAKAQESVTRHLYAQAGNVDEWMSQRYREAGRWSTTFIAYDALDAQARRTPDAARLTGELEAYLEELHSGYQSLYESFFVVDRKGRVIAGSRNESLEDWAVQQLPADTTTTDAQQAPGVLTPLRYSERLGHPTLLVLHRIERGSGAIGYFVARIDVRDLERVVTGTAASRARPRRASGCSTTSVASSSGPRRARSPRPAARSWARTRCQATPTSGTSARAASRGWASPSTGSSSCRDPSRE